ncbi:MAG TPA: hypothetical protein VIM64_15535 [Puia sp.]
MDRYLVSVLCPWMPSLGGISLMVVFLDIPVALPLIDPLPVAVLFSLFYSMVPARQTGNEGGGLSSIWGGVFILACWMAAGALLYHFAEGFLPRVVRNGIDSFGVHADINTPFTEYSTLHLRGGFILFACFIFGGRTLLKRIRRAAIAHPVALPPEPEPMPAPVPRITPPAQPVTIRQDAPVCTTLSAPPPIPARPKAAPKSISVVAPQQVRVYVTTEEMTAQY